MDRPAQVPDRMPKTLNLGTTVALQDSLLGLCRESACTSIEVIGCLETIKHVYIRDALEREVPQEGGDDWSS